MITEKMRHNANKIAFYVQQYPEKKVSEMLAVLELPAIDINTAFWAAQELGWISEPNKEKDSVELLSVPEIWDFGDNVAELEEALLYAFARLATKETDLEEFYISQWTEGYPKQDVLVAIKHLLVERKLAEYEVKDASVDEKGNKVYKDGEQVMETYIFYTLYENGEQMWGRKQFKVDPLAEK